MRILIALVDLLNEKILEDIPVKLLVSRAGVSRSTFYYNFRDIDDVVNTLTELFLQLFVSRLNRAEDAIRQDPLVSGSSISLAASDVLELVYNHRKEFQAMRASKRYHVFAKRFIEEIIRRGRDFDLEFVDGNGAAVTFPDDQLDYMLTYIAQFFLTTIEVWADHDFDLTPHELIELSARQASLLGTHHIRFRNATS